MGAVYDVVVVGGGTAGCALAGRLAQSGSGTVCLVEAGPDYGPRDGGRWPAELLDARALAFTHDWGVGGEDGRSLGARVLGGSSAQNACMVLAGTPADYDEWGDEWAWERFAPYLHQAAETLRTAPANTSAPAPAHDAFVEAAVATGFPLLDDPSDPLQPVGVARFPANVSADGVRVNAAFAYLDPVRGSPRLTIEPDTVVARVELAHERAVGVVTAKGERIGAGTVVLTAGAYFTPALLVRSGVGPAADLETLGVEPVADLPVGARLLDHMGTSLAWAPTEALDATSEAHEAVAGASFEPHAVVKAASSACPPGSWDVHVLSWLVPPDADGRRRLALIVFHMKPRSRGRLRVTSLDPVALPAVERGFLSAPEDADVIVEGIGIARRIAASEPLRSLLGPELLPGSEPLDEYVATTIRNYFHPAGTCAMGAVVDPLGRMLGIEGLVVADASVMPTIPRANPNLTVAAIAERIATTI